MTDREAEVRFLKQNLQELRKKLEPCSAYIKLERLSNTSLHITLDGEAFYAATGCERKGPFTYVDNGTSTPSPAEKNGFRLSFAIRPFTIVFDERPAHPNVYDVSKRMCTGYQTSTTTMLTLVGKAMRVILFDPGIVNTHSAACGKEFTWYRTMRDEGKFPCVNLAAFFSGEYHED